MQTRARQGLSIGAVAERTGLAVSAIRYYEDEGLVTPWRNSGGQRRFEGADIRRLSFIMVAQQCGFTLPQIRTRLAHLPQHKAPSRKDWTKISEGFHDEIETRIAALEGLRDKLDGCIGCGCLSLDVCALYNAGDKAKVRGRGPRYLMGDKASDL